MPDKNTFKNDTKNNLHFMLDMLLISMEIHTSYDDDSSYVENRIKEYADLLRMYNEILSISKEGEKC